MLFVTIGKSDVTQNGSLVSYRKLVLIAFPYFCYGVKINEKYKVSI